jgi:hypothetical protein
VTKTYDQLGSLRDAGSLRNTWDLRPQAFVTEKPSVGAPSHDCLVKIVSSLSRAHTVLIGTQRARSRDG